MNLLHILWLVLLRETNLVKNSNKGRIVSSHHLVYLFGIQLFYEDTFTLKLLFMAFNQSILLQKLSVLADGHLSVSL